MKTPHKHHDIIVAWADGAEIEYQILDGEKWWPVPVDAHDWRSGATYRIKPEPPKYPLSKLSDVDLINIANRADAPTAMRRMIANASVARAIEDGDVVTLDEHNAAFAKAKYDSQLKSGTVPYELMWRVAQAVYEKCCIDSGRNYFSMVATAEIARIIMAARKNEAPEELVPAAMLEQVARAVMKDWAQAIPNEEDIAAIIASVQEAP